jgi:hypothetical protein
VKHSLTSIPPPTRGRPARPEIPKGKTIRSRPRSHPTNQETAPYNDVSPTNPQSETLLNTMMPPRTAPQVSSTTTLLLFFIVLLCFFPNLFHLLWTLPLRLIIPAPSEPEPAPIPPSSPEQQQQQHPTMWTQKQFTLPSRARGSYLITDQVIKELPEIRSYKVGLLNLFVQHTSCALSLNENWDEVGAPFYMLVKPSSCIDFDIRM